MPGPELIPSEPENTEASTPHIDPDERVDFHMLFVTF